MTENGGANGTIALDFDGVLHAYDSGWQGAEVIADGPVEGAQDFVQMLLAAGFHVAIFSTRAATSGGRQAMEDWLREHGFPPVEDIVAGKPMALLYLDDRAMRFDGVWPTLTMIRAASRPWNK